MEAIVFIILQIFFAAQAVWKLGNVLGYFPVFMWRAKYSMDYKIWYLGFIVTHLSSLAIHFPSEHPFSFKMAADKGPLNPHDIRLIWFLYVSIHKFKRGL